MRITEVDKKLTNVELDQLEVFADRLFAKVGIDVEFTRHFLDRVNDDRNVKQITASELTRMFKQEYKKWGKPIAQLGPDAEAVLKDLATDLNIPFALRWDKENNELDLIAKTVMRKKNFKTSNREFEVQSVDYSLDSTQHKKVFESIQQLNEAGPAVAVLPIGIVAWQAYSAYRYSKAAWYVAMGAKATAITVAAYVVSRSDEFSWLERKMAASAIVAQQLWDKSLDMVGLGKEAEAVVAAETATLNTALVTGVEELTNTALETNELSPEMVEIINSVNASANLMNQQLADGVDPSEIAKTYISSLGASSAGVETASEENSAVGQTISHIAKVSPAVMAAISAEMEANYQNASGAEAAQIAATQLAIKTAQEAAAAKSAAQTKASDASLIALSTEIAQANADARATELSDKNLIALGTAYAKTQADLRATELSDAKLIAIGTEYAAQQAQLAHAEMQNDRIEAIANTSDKASALALATAQQTAHAEMQNARIEQIANTSDAEAKASAQTAASDSRLIALGTAIAATNAQQANDAYQNDKIASIAGASDKAAALAKSTADQKASAKFQNDRIASIAGASDAEAALAKSIAQQTAHATMQNDRIASIAGASDKAAATAKSIAQQTAHDEYQNDRIDQRATASDAEAALAKATALATAQTQAHDKYQNDRIASIAGASDKAAALAKSTADQKAYSAFQNARIDTRADAADAEAALVKSIAQQKAYSDMQNAKIDQIATKSDAEALKARLAKLSANQQAAHAAFQNARINDIASKSDSDAEAALKAREALKQAEAARAAFDAELYALQSAKASDDRLIAKANSVASVTTVPGVKGHHDTDIVVPGAAAGTSTIPGVKGHHDTNITVGTNTGVTTKVTPTGVAGVTSVAATGSNFGKGTKTRTGKKVKGRWGMGDDDGPGWKTEFERWQRKYGTFENANLNKYFMINEGGAMPGVGSVHIDEINPTLEALEKSIGIDLKDHVLGSVGKREFSGDIDVALDIKAEELPAFVEALKKNPLVLDIAKSSVIMTKVKIVDFDKSKTDGRPRTGFVQIDFMPGDPGWMKTYYHSPSDKESQYKGVFRNIMIASMAAVLDRQLSDAKLEDGRAMEELRYMWSPTEGLLRVKRTPVPNKAGTGYTKKNKNETVDGPWKQPDEIAKMLKLDSGADLNSFESLLTAMQKNWTKEAQRYVIDGFKENGVVKDVGIPSELDGL